MSDSGLAQKWTCCSRRLWYKQDLKQCGRARAQEFGKELGTPVVQSNITERRDPYFREIYTQLLTSLRSNGILRGVRPPLPDTSCPGASARHDVQDAKEAPLRAS